MDDKVVLSHDDLRKALVRIANEIVEKNQMARRSRSSASTPGGRCSRSACTRWSAS